MTRFKGNVPTSGTEGKRLMQRSLTNYTLRIHIRTSIQVLFDGFDVFFRSSIK